MATPNKFKYWPYLIILILATIADAVVIVFSWQMGITFWIMFIFFGLLLCFPILALLAGLVCVIKATYKLDSIPKVTLFLWAIIAILAIPISITMWETQNNQVRYYYDLPDNNTMTVWQEYIIFEKYTSFFPPRTNYIKLPSGTDEWELTIDSAGHSAVYVYKKAHKIKNVSPKYPLVAIYEGNPGQYWLYADFPADQWMAHFHYDYDHDGLASAGFLRYTAVVNDSVCHINGSYPGREYAEFNQGEPYVEPMDSFLISFHEDLKHSQSGNYRIKDGEYKYCFWPDSTQYSAFHKTK